MHEMWEDLNDPMMPRMDETGGTEVNFLEKAVSAHIELEVLWEKFKVLIDTGSDACLADISFWESITKSITHPHLEKIDNIVLLDFTGKRKTKARGKAVVPFTIAGGTVYVHCLILDGLNETVILGNDFLNQLNCVLDFETHTVTVKREGVSEVYKMLTTEEQEVKIESVRNVPRDETTDGSTHPMETIWNGRGISFEKHPELFATDEDIFEVVRSVENVDDSTRRRLLEILMEHRVVFARFPGECKNFEYKIEVDTEGPIVHRQYPVPKCYLPEIRDKLKEWEEWDIIAPSISDCSLPLHVTKKRSGELRLLLDCRRHNSHVKLEPLKCEKMNDLFEKFEGKKLYSSVDFTHSYLQCRLSKDSRRYLCFWFEGKLYEYRSICFGHKNGSAALNACLNLVFDASFTPHLVRYVDDCCFTSVNEEEHLELLDRALDRIKRMGMTLNLRKCEFFKSETKFLGMIINSEGKKKDSEAAQAIQNIPPPKNLKELRRLLGILNWHRIYIHRYGDLAQPLNELLQKGRKWKWEKVHDDCLDKLKEAVKNDVLLYYPKLEETFYVQTDASALAISAALYQVIDGEHRVVAYHSRVLNAFEKKYATIEKEGLAIVEAVKKWADLLIGREFVIRSDSKGLLHLPHIRHWNDKLMRWSLFLQPFTFRIEFLKGKDNCIPDMLSRNVKDGETRMLRTHPVKLFSEDILSLTPEILRVMQRESSRYEPIIAFLEEIYAAKDEEEKDKVRLKHSKSRTWEKFYKIENSLLLVKDFHFPKRWRLCVPEKLTKLVLENYHDKNGHLGYQKLMGVLLQAYYWPSMGKDARNHLRDCTVCARNKPYHPPTKQLLCEINVDKPRQLLSVDICGPYVLGKKKERFILTVLDCYTQYVQIYPMKNATGKSVADHLINMYFRHLGRPSFVLADNGSAFRSKEFRSRMQEEGVRIKYTTRYHPQSNPVERVHRNITLLLRTLCKDRHEDWSLYINEIIILLNYTINSSLGVAPIEMHLNADITLPLQRYLGVHFEDQSDDLKQDENSLWNNKLLMAEVRRRERIKKRNRKWEQAHSKGHDITLGSLVFLRRHDLSSKVHKRVKKLFALYYGPLFVSKRVGIKTFEVIDISTGKNLGIHSIDNMRIWLPTKETRSRWLKLVKNHLGEEEFKRKYTIIERSLKATQENTTGSMNEHEVINIGKQIPTHEERTQQKEVTGDVVSIILHNDATLYTQHQRYGIPEEDIVKKICSCYLSGRTKEVKSTATQPEGQERA